MQTHEKRQILHLPLRSEKRKNKLNEMRELVAAVIPATGTERRSHGLRLEQMVSEAPPLEQQIIRDHIQEQFSRA